MLTASASLLLASAWTAGDQRSDYLSARRKLDLIEAGRLPARSRVHLGERELNAYVRAKAESVAPDGLRNPLLKLGHSRATATALIDFAKLQKRGDRPLDRLMTKLLEGERPVRVDAMIRSSGGIAVVELERVEISGLAIQGAALDFLVDRFLIPRYPQATIGEPFALKHRIDRLLVEPGGVNVILR